MDLLLDIDSIRQKNPNRNIGEILCLMEAEYEEKGYIKRNPNRVAGIASNTAFLKYEKILWQSLGLIDTDYRIQWRKITEICALPEL